MLLIIPFQANVQNHQKKKYDGDNDEFSIPLTGKEIVLSLKDNENTTQLSTNGKVSKNIETEKNFTGLVNQSELIAEQQNPKIGTFTGKIP